MVYVLVEDGECVLFGWFYQYVVGFGWCDVEFVDVDWMDVLVVGGDYGYFQVGNVYVEVGY